MEIAVGEGYHSSCHALHRTGNRACQSKNQKHGYNQHCHGRQNRYQHRPVDQAAVIRFGNLNHQRPLGPANGRERHQHLLSVNGIFRCPRFTGGYTLRRVPVAAAELSQCTFIESQRLIRMPGHDAFLVNHIGHTRFSQVDTADHIVDRIVFIDTHHVQDRFAVLFHRHPHPDPKFPLEDGGGIGCEIVGFLQKPEKAAIQALRRILNPKHQPSVQIVQRDGVKFINFSSLLQHGHTIFPGQSVVRPECSLSLCSVDGGHGIHPGIGGNGHHTVRQHMYVRLHCFSRLSGHWLKTVQQNAFGK